MPLRDHFHPPVFARHSWEGLLGGWPAMFVQQLNGKLPNGFYAEPRVHLGGYFEIDMRGRAPVPWAPPEPTAILEVEPMEPSEYEVLVYDESRARRLVAAVENVSPANKDHPEHRRAFATKCAAMLNSDVCVSIVDLVTIRRTNLYAEVLELMGRTDPTLPAEPPALYAVTCRRQRLDRGTRLKSWAYPLEIGRALPTLPLWLTEDLAVSLDLEVSYEETCRVLRIS